jgi:hypothetical protein
MSEIWWILKVVMYHFSFHSNIGINDLFHCMFPDSSMASKFFSAKPRQDISPLLAWYLAF